MYWCASEARLCVHMCMCTCVCICGGPLSHGRFDTNRDNMLSFDEFCHVADVAIDGDSKLAAPSVAAVPAGGKRTAPSVPAEEVSTRLRSLQAAGAPPVRGHTG